MRRLLIIAFGVLILGLLNWNVLTYEELRTGDNRIFFKLAPVDPRSLMQGDYMDLNYEIATQAGKAVGEKTPEVGKLVLQVDEDSVATFDRFYDGGFLVKEKELNFPYVRSGFLVHLRPDSFFFQEGHGSYYQQAEYGVFSFNEDGKFLLIGLADKDREILDSPPEQ